MTEPSQDLSQDPVGSLVRDLDFDRYAATLFAPAAARPYLTALAAYDLELARVRDVVSDPMPGEIRLQWRRDALAEPERADAMADPVMRALEAAIRHGALPRPALDGLAEARIADLYDDPIASVDELTARLGETHSVPLRLATLILAGGKDPGGADVAGHGGVALGLARMLAALPAQAARGQLLLPTDRMAAHGVRREDVIAWRASPGLAALLRELSGLARGHLASARAAFDALEPVAAPAFLPLALVDGDLNALDRRADQPFAPRARPAIWLRLLRLWRASKRARPF